MEPQRVQPGCRGVTYRYWDWNRRYDQEGNLHPNGLLRALHVNESLEVTDWNMPRETALLERIRIRRGSANLHAQATLELLCGPQCELKSNDLEVSRLFGTGPFDLEPREILRGLTLFEGTAHLTANAFDMTVHRGQSVVLPAALPATRIELHAAHAMLCSADFE